MQPATEKPVKARLRLIGWVLVILGFLLIPAIFFCFDLGETLGFWLFGFLISISLFHNWGLSEYLIFIMMLCCQFISVTGIALLFRARWARKAALAALPLAYIAIGGALAVGEWVESAFLNGGSDSGTPALMFGSWRVYAGDGAVSIAVGTPWLLEMLVLTVIAAPLLLMAFRVLRRPDADGYFRRKKEKSKSPGSASR